jgi:hypothetical protein
VATSANQVEAVFRSKLGVKESPAGSNRTEFGAWYGMQAVPWCAIFISWGFYTAFRGNGDTSPLEGIRTPKGFAYCGDVIAHAKKQGRFQPEAKRGYIVVYDFPGNADRFDHVGWVSWVDPADRKHFRALEGNTAASASGSQSDGGMVVEKDRRNDQGYVHGFYDVPYTGTGAAPAAPAKPGGAAWPGRVITLTSPFTRGSDVVAVQARLNYRRTTMGESWVNQLAADGIYGPASAAAVREYQNRHRLDVDGQVGPVTWQNLHTSAAVK